MRLRGTPVSIPNTMVKTQAAEDTALETVRESRWPPVYFGGVAQLGEHLPCKQGVKSSNLSVSIAGERVRQAERTLKTSYRARYKKKPLNIKTTEKQKTQRKRKKLQRYAAKEEAKQERAQGGCLGTKSR